MALNGVSTVTMQTERVIGMPGGGRIYIACDSSRALNQLAAENLFLDNPTPLLKEWGTIIRNDARRQFADGGDPNWKQLAASTIAQKIVSGYPARTAKGNVPRRLLQKGQFSAGSILIASGKLRDSWANKNNSDHVEVIDLKNMRVTEGSRNPLAIFHQYGTKPYTIRPKGTGRFLAFVGAGGKFIVTTKAIHHPGLPARPVRITETARDLMIAAAIKYIRGEASNGPESNGRDS